MSLKRNKQKESALLKSELGEMDQTPMPQLVVKIIYLVSLAFAIFGILTNSFVLINALKKAGIFVGFVLALVYLVYPLKIGKNKRQIRWLDYILSVLGLVAGWYIAFSIDRLSLTNLAATPMDFAMGVLVLLLLLEATRRCVGPVMVILPLVFVAYALYGNHIPGIFGHFGIELKRFIIRMTMTSDGIYGLTTNVASSYIFLFILFGSLLGKSGVGQFFTDFANRIAGSATGGSAKVAVLSSGLMGTISGSAAANVATTGAFTIPMMKKAGFAPRFAGAVEAVASTGGMIMPPIMGSAAFIMANYLSVPYSKIMAAAIIPALLYYLSAFCWVHFMAARIGMKGVSRAQIPPIEDFRRRVWLFLPLVAIVVAMILGKTAIFAAFIGMVVTALVGFCQRNRLTLKGILDALANGSNVALSALLACITAGIIVGVCNMTGLGATVTYNIVALSGGHLFFALLLTAVASIILSMGLPATACYIVVATIVAPALVNMGAAPIAAHMFVFYFSCLSNITPPVAIASFTAAGIAQTKPFAVGIDSIKIALPGFLIPFMFSYEPMLVGVDVEAFALCRMILTAVIGVVFLAVCGAGFFKVKLPWYARLLFGAGALLMITPTLLTDGIGIGLIVAAIIISIIKHKAAQKQPPAEAETLENTEAQAGQAVE